MKKMLRTIRVLLNRHYLGNSINAFVVGLAATASFYGLYFAVVIGIQQIFFDVVQFNFSFSDVRPATANVVFNFFALGLLWRYWTPARVIRFWLRGIREVATPYWFAWRTGHRITALSPIIALALIFTVAAVLVPQLDQRAGLRRKASVNGVSASGVSPTLLDFQEVPCLTVTGMPKWPEEK